MDKWCVWAVDFIQDIAVLIGLGEVTDTLMAGRMETATGVDGEVVVVADPAVIMSTVTNRRTRIIPIIT